LSVAIGERLDLQDYCLGPVDRFPPVDAEWIPKSVFR
jgi:hypothetical protein